jgi:8-oxo-dGTP pyrophosphatase MutT (NUDIX family)
MIMARQIGALPVRKRGDGALEILLVTTRETRRWVIPKGWPWPEAEDHEAAAGEAREEAGVLGRAARECLGVYHYDKRRNSGDVPVCVNVHLLEVDQELDSWPEQRERERRWFSPKRAAAAVQEPELKALIRRLKAEIA